MDESVHGNGLSDFKESFGMRFPLETKTFPVGVTK